MAVSLTTSPAIVTGSGNTSPTTTASFSPVAGTLLLAIAAAGKGSSTTIGCSDSSGKAWTTAVTSPGGGANGGRVSIFYTYLSAAPGSITVSAAFTGLTGGRLLDVVVLLGCNPTQNSGATTSSSPSTGTAGTLSVVTTIAGSLVFGAGDLSSGSSSWAANGVTTKRGANNGLLDGIEQASWKASNVTGTPGSTTLGGTWGNSGTAANAAFEVLPGTGAYTLARNRPVLQAVCRSYYY